MRRFFGHFMLNYNLRLRFDTSLSTLGSTGLFRFPDDFHELRAKPPR